ncbi:hypothetical protein SmJEL517_g01756 [Synchytrium microbalum]|uniref:protein-tyrosine-phosphatase n=1 Tax=Synchytrium microbalum TaxID=1806994 RepID=A0A507CES1_9FUNG|nr:uncharacterized protein SmJEL517_g01756 [Synchytrium microbalum]TPX36013.1 hypothetical protein SmJEL517_g01756 [Synchytrium microbalum]
MLSTISNTLPSQRSSLVCTGPALSNLDITNNGRRKSRPTPLSFTKNPPKLSIATRRSASTSPLSTPTTSTYELQGPTLGFVTTPPHSASKHGKSNSESSISLPPYTNGPAAILPNLYLGSEINARDVSRNIKLGIGYVLNVAQEVVLGASNHHDDDGTSQGAEELQELFNSLLSPLAPRPVMDEDSSGSCSFSDTASNSSYEDTVSSPSDMALYENLRNLLESSPALSRRAHHIYKNPHHQRCVSDSSINSTLSRHSSNSITTPPPSTSVTSPSTLQHVNNNTLVYKNLSWSHDEPHIISHLPSAFSFIDAARGQNRAVLVNCQQGVSRSASLVIAYIMRSMNMTAWQAYTYVKERAPHISPNLSLMSQLVEFEKWCLCDTAAASADQQ